MLPPCLLLRAPPQFQACSHASRRTPLLYFYSNLRFLHLNLYIFTSTATFKLSVSAKSFPFRQPETGQRNLFFKWGPEVIKEGDKKHPHAKVQLINLTTCTLGTRMPGKGTQMWPRGYNVHPHSCYFAIFSGFSEDPLQVLLILRAEVLKYSSFYSEGGKKRKEFVYYTVHYIYKCNLVSLADLSSKFASKRLRLQYWIR